MTALLSHSFPQKIPPDCTWYSLLWISSQFSLQIKVVSFASNPQVQGQVPLFMPPSDMVAKIYPQALGSLPVAFCNSQGYGGGIIKM
jgi:hypothetical protein